MDDGVQTSGIGADSWTRFWDERALGKVTLDQSAFYWDLCIPALLSDAKPGIDEVFGLPESMGPLFEKLEQLRIPKWYSTGAELANLILQDAWRMIRSSTHCSSPFRQQSSLS